MKDCVDWPGSRDKDGYGFVKIQGKQMRAHRIALEIKLGRKLVMDEMALHICDNPSCINQEHLLLGDVKMNNKMMRSKKQTLADMLLPGWKDLYSNE